MQIHHICTDLLGIYTLETWGWQRPATFSLLGAGLGLWWGGVPLVIMASPWSCLMAFSSFRVGSQTRRGRPRDQFGTTASTKTSLTTCLPLVSIKVDQCAFANTGDADSTPPRSVPSMYSGLPAPTMARMVGAISNAWPLFIWRPASTAGPLSNIKPSWR